MSPRQQFTTVADYLKALEPAHAKALRSVLATVKKAVPKASPVISYGIPAFKLDSVFIYCAAFKRHIGVYPPVRGDARLQAALKPFANAKGNLSFALDEKMPLSLIGRVAKALARQYTLGRSVRGKRKPRRREQ